MEKHAISVGSIFFQNAGIYLQAHTKLQPTTTTMTITPHCCENLKSHEPGIMFQQCHRFQKQKLGCAGKEYD
jgi:hypothetical protein